MRAITEAIAARHAQIKTLQSDIETLQRAASIMGGETIAKATRQPKPTRKVTPKRKPMSAAAKKAVSQRMKAYWATRKKSSAPAAAPPAQPTATRKRKPMSAAAKKAMSKRLKA